MAIYGPRVLQLAGEVADGVIMQIADPSVIGGVMRCWIPGFCNCPASPLPPVKRLRSKGVCVFAGNDNVRDSWSPYGNGDLLERAMLLAWRSGFRTDEDLAVAFDTISGAGAQALGLDDYGLEVGKRADFMCVQAETLAEAVVSRSHRGLVVKRGEIVAQDGAWKLS